MPSVAATKFTFFPAVAELVGVNVAVAVPLAVVVPDAGEIVPAPAPPTVQAIGKPPCGLLDESRTVTVTVYGEPPAVNVVEVGLRVTVTVPAESTM